MEGDFARSEGAPGLAELENYQRMANTMRRLLETLGLQRRPGDVTPTLGQYLTARATAAGNGELWASRAPACWMLLFCVFKSSSGSGFCSSQSL